VKALRAVPGLALCDDETLLEIVGDSVNLRWQAGEPIFERGSDSDALFVVLGGSVRVLTGEGSEVARLGAGEYFGEIAMLLGVPHRNDVVAAEDTELMVVPKERVDALFAANPGLAERIRALAATRAAATAA
jgi:CRP-like cAMP-binding protein